MIFFLNAIAFCAKKRNLAIVFKIEHYFLCNIFDVTKIYENFFVA